MARKIMPLIAAAGLLLCSLPAAAEDKADLEQRGRTLVASHCSRCHAIDRAGNSPHHEAPPFRTLGRRYPIDSLAEALGEGLFTGHPDMPEFVFEVRDVSAILAYLQSIQQPEVRQPSKKVIK
jgi:cytochrome c